MNPSRQTASEMYCAYCRLNVSWTRFHSVVNSQNEKTLRRRARSPVFVILQAPVLELLAEWHEVRGLGADAPPLALDDGVAQAEPRRRPVLVERLADGLPCCGPEVAASLSRR